MAWVLLAITVAGVLTCSIGFLLIASVTVEKIGDRVLIHNTGAAFSNASVRITSAGVQYEVKLNHLARGETEVGVSSFRSIGKSSPGDYGTAVTGQRLGMSWTAYTPARVEFAPISTVPDR